MTNTTPIKASVGMKRVSAGDVLARGNAVLAGLYADKDDYANPPIDEQTLKSQLNGLSTAIAAALDGGRQALAERDHQKEIVAKSLRQLGHYVEENCKDNMMIFLKSGFQPISTTRTQSPPVSDWFRKIVPGQNSGQIAVTLVAQADALSYQLRWAAVDQSGTLGTFSEQPVGRIKPPVVVSGLTPGKTYVFQARAVTNSGYTDWSQSVTRICT